MSYVDTSGYILVAGAMAVINIVADGGVSEVPVPGQTVAGPHNLRDRFKIVKVETRDPLKRCRWTCYDVKDKPAVKEKEEKGGRQEKRNPPSSSKTVSTSSSTLTTSPEQGQSRGGGFRPTAAI